MSSPIIWGAGRAKLLAQSLGLEPVSADPSNPVQGQLQYSDGTAHTEGLWVYDGADWNQVTPASSGPEIEVIYESQTSGTNGGNITGTGAWYQRTLNTSEGSNSWVSLSSNRFTLNAGTYHVQWSSPMYGTNSHKSRLYNFTDSTTIAVSQVADSDAGGSNYINTSSLGSTVFTLAASKALQIDYRCSANPSISDALGQASGFGVAEIFTIVTITKLA